MTQAVIAVLEQILSSDAIISVVVQFPKAAVEDVKVFVGKVSRNLVDVLFFINLLKRVQ